MQPHFTLDDKDQELIAVSASIASGCVPCTTFHLRAARMTGAEDVEIDLAARAAGHVRRRATEIMTLIAGNQKAEAPDTDTPGHELEACLGQLILVSAAFAANCVPLLETYLVSARQQGATGDQILTTLKIACAVKNMAGKKVQNAAARAFGGDENQSDACECSGDGALSGADMYCASAADASQPESRADRCSCHTGESPSSTP